ncbi:putative RNA [Escherichia coli]|nr:putative RNA [Escherichia coli]
MVREARLELAHLAAPEPKSGASTNFATPAKKSGYDGIRTCDPIIMSDVL